MNSPKASIVIPTLNAGPGFESLLHRLFSQESDLDLEVIIVDSGSTDGTVETARRRGAFVQSIPASEFDHGTARNRGIELSTGEYVALTVQDAVPLDKRWLAAMVENLDRDPLVAGVYGRQVPRPDSDDFTRVLVDSWPTADLDRREQFAGSPEQYRGLPASERRRLATFDNVSSCLRRSVWERLPFEKTSFGEDLRWGKSVVEAGHKIVYEPRSAVAHSHGRGVGYDLRRNYVDQRVLLELFGPASSMSALSLPLDILRAWASLYRRLYENGGLKGAVPRTPAALKYAVASRVGAHLGGLGHRLDRKRPGLSGILGPVVARGKR